MTSLPRDYYDFDPAGHRLTGKNSGQQYRLSDEMEVTVASVNLDDKKIDFIVPGSGDEDVKPKKSKKRKKRRG